MATEELIVAPKWHEVLLKSWAVWVAGLGLVLPEILDFILANLDQFPLDGDVKKWVRMAALLLVIVVRPIPQRSLRKQAVPLKGNSQ